MVASGATAAEVNSPVGSVPGSLTRLLLEPPPSEVDSALRSLPARGALARGAHPPGPQPPVSRSSAAGCSDPPVLGACRLMRGATGEAAASASMLSRMFSTWRKARSRTSRKAELLRHTTWCAASSTMNPLHPSWPHRGPCCLMSAM
eukprot:8137174-Pyramimonas_sp.AAC.1